MIRLYVEKSWLTKVGNAADEMLVWGDDGTYVALLAATVNSAFPFVEVRLCRKPGESKDLYMMSHIPPSVITGMFDMTQEQEKKYGFGKQDESPN